MSRQILNGWKEISSYINRSVRTVQRWEARLGLPVYRPALKDRSAVMAFSDEVDRWISRASPDMGEEDAVLNGNGRNDADYLAGTRPRECHGIGHHGTLLPDGALAGATPAVT